MRRLSIFLLVGSLLSGQPADNQCALTFRVVNVAGATLPYRVTSIKDTYGTEYVQQFDGLSGRVPCSRIMAYQFEAKWSGVPPRVADITKVEGKVFAGRPETWLTLSTDPGIYISDDGTMAGSVNASMPNNSYVLNGLVTPVPQERLWIHMRSAAPRPNSVSAEIEAETDAIGQFRAYGPFFKGPYLLYVMNRAGRILHTMLLRPESILPKQPLEIALPSLPPPEVVLK